MVLVPFGHSLVSFDYWFWPVVENGRYSYMYNGTIIADADPYHWEQLNR